MICLVVIHEGAVYQSGVWWSESGIAKTGRYKVLGKGVGASLRWPNVTLALSEWAIGLTFSSCDFNRGAVIDSSIDSRLELGKVKLWQDVDKAKFVEVGDPFISEEIKSEVDTVHDDNSKSDLRRRKKVSVFNCLRKLWAAWKACFFQSGFPGCRNWCFFLSFRFFDLEFES